MGQFTEEDVVQFLEAADRLHQREDYEAAVIKAARFMQELGKQTQEETCSILATIDFTQPVIVGQLPRSVFVYSQKDRYEHWVTDTGYTKESLAHGGRLRKRKIFYPTGVVPALKVTAVAMQDRCTVSDLFQAINPVAKQKIGAPNHNAGVQYLVFNETAFREI